MDNGLKFIVPNKNKDRTTILSIKEIMGDKVYDAPLNQTKKIIVDLGSNVGVYSLYIALKNPKAKIYAVEPDSDNFKQLQENILVNGFKRRISAFQYVISKKCGKVPFFVDNISSRAHSLYHVTGKKVQVPSIDLNSLFKKLKIKKCDILKLDIEGAEYEVLYNCPEKILRSINIVFVECHNLQNLDLAYSKKNMKEFLIHKQFRILRDKGEVLFAQNCNLDFIC